MKQEKLKNRGITLIALVITIIVMLILVGVTINVAMQGGLFGKAQEAKTKTEEAQIQEKDILTGRIKVGDKWYDSLDKYLEGKESENQSDGSDIQERKFIDVELQRGDYVNLHYTSESGEDESVLCMFLR